MPGVSIFWAVFLISASTLALQVLLTRVFSVIMSYHMSLVSVSMTMFGLTLGALWVYARNEDLTRAKRTCATAAEFFGVFVFVSLFYCLATPVRPSASFSHMGAFLVWNGVASLPFIFSGICLAVVLTRFPKFAPKLYAFDLAGAALACLGVVFILNKIDALSALLLCGVLGFLASLLFVLGFKLGKARILRCLILLLAGIWLAHTNVHRQWFRINYSVNNAVDNLYLRHEFWNVFSYVRVTRPQPGRFYWGQGEKAPMQKSSKDDYLRISMDIRNSTPLIDFEGRDWERVSWLNYDVTNIVHQLRHNGPVLVIGSGGGRDILSALLPTRGARKVAAVDINPHMVRLLTSLESVYAGHLEQFPGVSFAVDEARSWISRSHERFQVIVIPLVDTSAASAAGAYALTENNLYTVEAFKTFIGHLSDDGILSVSRWWYKGLIGESHRLVGLAAEALRQSGVSSPWQHLVVVRGRKLCTLLLSRVPFSQADLAALQNAADQFGFELMLTPEFSLDKVMAVAAQDPSWHTALSFKHVNLAPPSDDRPFFFQSYKMRNLFQNFTQDQVGVAENDKMAMVILMVLILAASALGLILFGTALYLEKRHGGGKAQMPATTLGYFATIGFAFMFFEAAQLQRLNIFLGYPVYALTVVLFGLLLSAAAGSFACDFVVERRKQAAPKVILPALLGMLTLLGLLTPLLIGRLMGQPTYARILIALLVVCPAGFFMGMMFPLGFKLLSDRGERSLTLCWAINGMTSACAAIYAIALGISFGFTVTYWLSVIFYALAGYLCQRPIYGIRALSPNNSPPPDSGP